MTLDAKKSLTLGNGGGMGRERNDRGKKKNWCLKDGGPGAARPRRLFTRKVALAKRGNEINELRNDSAGEHKLEGDATLIRSSILGNGATRSNVSEDGTREGKDSKQSGFADSDDQNSLQNSIASLGDISHGRRWGKVGDGFRMDK